MKFKQILGMVLISAVTTLGNPVGISEIYYG